MCSSVNCSVSCHKKVSIKVIFQYRSFSPHLLLMLVLFAMCYQGFEPRGTELSDRLVTFENLVKNVGAKTNLLPFATHIQPASGKHEPVARLQTSHLFHPAQAHPDPVPTMPDGGPLLRDYLVKQNSRGYSQQSSIGQDQHRNNQRKVVGAGSIRQRRGRRNGRKERARWSKRLKKSKDWPMVERLSSQTFTVNVMGDAPQSETNSTEPKLRSFCGVPGELYTISGVISLFLFHPCLLACQVKLN